MNFNHLYTKFKIQETKNKRKCFILEDQKDKKQKKFLATVLFEQNQNNVSYSYLRNRNNKNSRQINRKDIFLPRNDTMHRQTHQFNKIKQNKPEEKTNRISPYMSRVIKNHKFQKEQHTRKITDFSLNQLNYVKFISSNHQRNFLKSQNLLTVQSKIISKSPPSKFPDTKRVLEQQKTFGQNLNDLKRKKRKTKAKRFFSRNQQILSCSIELPYVNKQRSGIKNSGDSKLFFPKNRSLNKSDVNIAGWVNQEKEEQQFIFFFS